MSEIDNVPVDIWFLESVSNSLTLTKSDVDVLNQTLSSGIAKQPPLYGPVKYCCGIFFLRTIVPSFLTYTSL